MTIDFNQPYPEPGSVIGFGQNGLTSASEARDEKSLSNALAHPEPQFHVLAGGKVLVRKDANPSATFSPDEIARFAPKMDRAIFLGDHESGPRLAVPAKIDEEALDEPYHLYDFRSLLYSSSVADEEASAIARAGSLLYWHRMNRHCGKCGAESQSRIGGYRRDCPACGSQIFPRTDPVVIMLAIREEKCLLGRSPHFPPGWYSTLAGFVEPGETIEAAVRRETLEESGISVRRVQYHASQPWPFPHSLMIGAYGEATSEDIRFDSDELEDCLWFTRDDVRQMIRDEHPRGFKCPPTKAISHALIKNWVES